MLPDWDEFDQNCGTCPKIGQTWWRKHPELSDWWLSHPGWLTESQHVEKIKTCSKAPVCMIWDDVQSLPHATSVRVRNPLQIQSKKYRQLLTLAVSVFGWCPGAIYIFICVFSVLAATKTGNLEAKLAKFEEPKKLSHGKLSQLPDLRNHVETGWMKYWISQWWSASDDYWEVHLGLVLEIPFNGISPPKNVHIYIYCM